MMPQAEERARKGRPKSEKREETPSKGKAPTEVY
jgi:hypothetical protein